MQAPSWEGAICLGSNEPAWHTADKLRRCVSHRATAAAESLRCRAAVTCCGTCWGRAWARRAAVRRAHS
eukprot:357700-Chlamydomonas_euryale.AAC.5